MADGDESQFWRTKAGLHICEGNERTSGYFMSATGIAYDYLAALRRK